MAGSDLITDGLHLEALQEFTLVHKAFEGVGPAITDGLEVLHLMNVYVEGLQGLEVSSLCLVGLLDEGLGNPGDRLIKDDLFLHHVLKHECLARLKVKVSCVHIQFWILGSLIWVRDAREVLDNALSCFLV